MNVNYVCEKGQSSSTAHEQEEEIARRWWALPLHMYLPLSNGDNCELLYAGRSGGSLGPDVRDAVLRFTNHRSMSANAGTVNQDASNVMGDVEIHMRASDWFTHQHHTDARYNNVILHVVLIYDSTRPTLRQDGNVIPTCSLYDLPYTPTPLTHLPTTWPCHHLMARMNEKERTRLLMLAGMLHFEQKAHTFIELLPGTPSSELFSAYDVCLIPALAEGLGYGRDRTFFRAAGLHLIGVAKNIPEPLGRAPDPSPLDTNRLRILRNLVEQWRTTGAWHILQQALLASQESLMANAHPPRGDASVPSPLCSAAVPRRGTHPDLTSITPTVGDASVPSPTRSPATPTTISGLHKLRNAFDGLGKARTDILICNIVLPFAAAIAQQENDTTLAEQARSLFSSYPGLPSNQITRAMCKQLLLKNEPRGACQQQGLHFIYAQTCREKRCIDCMFAKHGELNL